MASEDLEYSAQCIWATFMVLYLSIYLCVSPIHFYLWKRVTCAFFNISLFLFYGKMKLLEQHETVREFSLSGELFLSRTAVMGRTANPRKQHAQMFCIRLSPKLYVSHKALSPGSCGCVRLCALWWSLWIYIIHF